MLKTLFIFSLIFLKQTADISIISPQTGDTLIGQVEIIGNMDVLNFANAELAFSYASNPADSWFTIQTFPQPVRAESPTLAIWDTTTLSDGDYILHLRVLFQDGSSQDIVISDLKVRNDAPPATKIPTITVTSGSITINPHFTATNQPATLPPSFPSSTPLPANPVSVTSFSIYSNFARGAIMTLFLFIVFSLLLRLRKT